MNEKMAAVCSAVGIVGAAVAEMLGGWDNAIVTMLIFMGIDFVLGLVCAFVFGRSPKSEHGGLSSSACWKGLVKKVCTLLIVVAAHYADVLLGAEYIRNAVIIAFCASELISICENAGCMGILPQSVQNILEKIIDTLKNTSENT
ncbi:MAG: holin family protein [Oscillospiraceae bacterium]